jgi:hypothetical protein
VKPNRATARAELARGSAIADGTIVPKLSFQQTEALCVLSKGPAHNGLRNEIRPDGKRKVNPRTIRQLIKLGLAERREAPIERIHDAGWVLTDAGWVAFRAATNGRSER